ncbi:hypothetical protein [Nocardiopsis valliformis]|uniref:hypothetical protein n=1 Tax=Nocardiopsis valliformis TaxID=239974 RepID=UPI0012685FA9|nr:hypothetical protein [Nocardiopsis valliformis]
MGPELFGGTDADLAELELGEELGSGGQGKVIEVSGGRHKGLVYKRYTLPGPNADALLRLVRAPESFSPNERERLFSLSSWPLARVMSSGRLTGFLMRRIPSAFLGRLKGGDLQLQEAQYLMYPPKPLWGDIRPPTVEGRLELAKQYVSLFQLLHAHSLVAGDVSMANLLWSTAGTSRVFILDCDGIRCAGQPPVLPQAQTPDWEDPLLPATGSDLETDRYKLALLVGRVLARNPTIRPGDPLTPLPELPPKVVEAVTQRFDQAGAGYGKRPDAWQWGIALGGRRQVPVSVPQPVSGPVPPLSPLQKPMGQRRWTPVPVQPPGQRRPN